MFSTWNGVRINAWDNNMCYVLASVQKAMLQMRYPAHTHTEKHPTYARVKHILAPVLPRSAHIQTCKSQQL
jgi:hypothetical protein